MSENRTKLNFLRILISDCFFKNLIVFLSLIFRSPDRTSGLHVTFVQKNDGRTTLSPQQNGEYTQMMDKCTDILQKVQKHVQNNNI